MAKESGHPTAEEKGKGKAVDDNAANGENEAEEAKKGKDATPTINGKKDGDLNLPDGPLCLRSFDELLLTRVLL